MVIVLAHWAEHLFQAFQIYGLGWPVPEARGLLGLFLSLADQVGERCTTATRGDARRALAAAVGLQRHHRSSLVDDRARHSVLPSLRARAAVQLQAMLGHNFFGQPVPTSLVQLWVPRVELHLFYNTIVFIPMVIAMYFHMFPPQRSPQPAVHLRVGPRPRRRGLSSAIAARCGRPTLARHRPLPALASRAHRAPARAPLLVAVVLVAPRPVRSADSPRPISRRS